jgi:Conjugative transposon protein TcpC
MGICSWRRLPRKASSIKRSLALSVESSVADVTHARVKLDRRPMWRIRLGRDLPRYLLCTVSLAGLAASARFAIAPPRPIREASTLRPMPAPDRAAEGFAVLFARRYLSWNAAEPQSSVRALESFTGGGMEAAAGLALPPSGEQQVEWAEVVQAREVIAGEHLYTVAAQTDSAGLLYLAVSVSRTLNGALALAGYPAFVGAPASGAAHPSGGLQEVSDPGLSTVVERALRNYLASALSELAADLSPGARVSLPAMALTLEAVQRLRWSAGGRSVVAQVQAQDSRGVQYTLAYELAVVREQGRWEISAVQMDPDA